MSATPGIRAIAFYLPQFHPVPENDAWWGKGFTEWTNVTKAEPLFHGHYQPHLPGELGFYDLRLSETRAAQAELAREHGLHGFCYYHYWFNGRRVLGRPFDEVLTAGQPDFPFCLCWANENWTRRWDGQEREVLLAQNYSHEDDIAHIRWLARAFRDPRYIRVDGKPLFLVYRLFWLPDPSRTIATWRDEAQKLGLGELFLCNVEGTDRDRGLAPQHGLDAAVEFAPDWAALPTPILPPDLQWLGRRLANRPRIRHRAEGLRLLSPPKYADSTVFAYANLAHAMLAKPEPSYRRFPCVTPSWDNSPRRRAGALIMAGSTPELYAAWLQEVLRRAQSRQGANPIVFINAWNEWAEGSHLEPCQKWGRAYLERTRDALSVVEQTASPGPCRHQV
ncbi:MAG: glycoside hydrolase family 99-like domain-containing protein [Verrucomicrobia bacterium]|nr:glycoside hydrolase family 99-like domain-containing protein [Verrucomicrobiota bacterium]